MSYPARAEGLVNSTIIPRAPPLIIIIYSLRVFHIIKTPQVSWTHLSILTDLNGAVVWMVSTCPFISNPSSLFSNPLVTTKNNNDKWYKRRFHVPRFFSIPKVEVLIFFLIFFQFYFVVSQESKFQILQVLFLLLIIIRSGRLA